MLSMSSGLMSLMREGDWFSGSVAPKPPRSSVVEKAELSTRTPSM
jgi:hypothetical protein